MYVICIDPGTYSSGYAGWSLAGWQQPDALPTVSGLMTTSKYDEPVTRIQTMNGNMYDLFATHQPTRVAIELPQLFAHAVSQAAAQRGDLGLIYMAVGAIVCAADRTGATVELVPVRDWKGNMKKGLVEKRIRDYFNGRVTGVVKDTWDAIGIGLYLKGVAPWQPRRKQVANDQR